MVHRVSSDLDMTEANQHTHMQILFWALDSIPLVFMSVFIPVPCGSDYYNFVIKFEIWECDASVLFFYLRDCFEYSGSFVVPYKIQIVCSMSVKISFGILITKSTIFHQCLRVSVYRTITSLVKFVPNNLSVFCSTVNRIVFLIFPYGNLYQNATDFCI